MSEWTHVSGILSCSANPFKYSDLNKLPSALLEKIVGYYEQIYWEPDEFWDDAIDKEKIYGRGTVKLPEGSEGPLQFKCFSHSMKSCVHNSLIVFWGDLRDYGDYEVNEDLIPWFKDLLKRLNENNIHVREGTILIDTEYTKTKTILISDSEDGHDIFKVIKCKKSFEVTT